MNLLYLHFVSAFTYSDIYCTHHFFHLDNTSSIPCINVSCSPSLVLVNLSTYGAITTVTNAITLYCYSAITLNTYSAIILYCYSAITLKTYSTITFYCYSAVTLNTYNAITLYCYSASQYLCCHYSLLLFCCHSQYLEHSLQFLRNLIGQFQGAKSLSSPLLRSHLVP